MATKNETINKVNNVKANESANVDNVDTTPTTDNTTDESKPQATAPTSEQIAAARVETKHQKEIGERYAMEAPKEVEVTKFAGATVLGVWRAPKDVKKNGDKTFFKVYYNGTIYDGYTSTEFCDTVGIERKHRAGTTKKESTLLDKLQALKAAIEAVDSKESDFVNFAKIVAQKIESEQIESERAAFVAKYAAAITFFQKLTEQDFSDENGADDLALALKLGYKFKDTKATDKATDNTNESK